MKIGVTFPTHEIGTNAGDVRAFAQAAEALGFDYLVAIDHVLGVDPDVHDGYEPIQATEPRYLVTYAYHELFVLFGFLAAVTERIELFTGVLILPQRQTALVAKQAAEVDVLCGGRLRLGVGVGHTDLEFQGLGIDFRTRGARIEEQIEVLRSLWTQPSVTYHGRFHDLDGVGINPLPVQRPIPIWMGGWSDVVLRRAARLADGLMMPRRMDEMRRYLGEAGRDVGQFGFSNSVSLHHDRAGQAAEAARDQEALGITHLAVNTQAVGHRGLNDHIEALQRFTDAYRA
jgi:probable F420-dependent oxidoreductase